MRKAERGSSLSKEAASQLSKEPMWCFEVSHPFLPHWLYCKSLHRYLNCSFCTSLLLYNPFTGHDL